MKQGKRDMIGRRFGRLVCLRISERKDKTRRLYWWFRCDCGNEKEAAGSSVRYGETPSCGCLHRENVGQTVHGMARTKLYHVWNSMIQRCHNPKTKRYDCYGGRGIIVCDRWRHSFADFFADMGECPAGLTIERLNNDGNYEPSNCVWASRHQQARNKRPRRVRCACGSCRLCRDREKHRAYRERKAAA